jgi:parvulin-like peptidyl-prolyl isomerase
MQRTYTAAILSAAIFLTSLSLYSAEEILVDTVVATVNGVNITLSEVRPLEQALSSGKLPENATREEIAQLRIKYFKEALDSVIAQKLILDEAGKMGIIVLDREVNSVIEREIAEGGYENIEHMLEATNTTKSELSRQIKEDRLYRRVIRYKIHPKIRISPQAIRDYYNDNIEEYQDEEKVHLLAITFFANSDPEQDKKILETAEDVLRQLHEGADFPELAKEHSMDIAHAKQGGDWGWIDREGNIAAYAAFDLSVNEISEIVKTKNSYWILKVIGKKAAQTVPPAQVWNEIEEKLRLLELVSLRKEWTEKLRKKANIIYPLSLEEQLAE